MAWGSLRSACYPFRSVLSARRSVLSVCQAARPTQSPIVTVLKLRRGLAGWWISRVSVCVFVWACVWQLVVVIAALMPHSHPWPGVHFSLLLLRRLSLLLLSPNFCLFTLTKCVTTATTTTTTSSWVGTIAITITGSSGPLAVGCLLSYHAQLDNFYLPGRQFLIHMAKEPERFSVSFLCLFQFALQREGILSCIFAGSLLIELHLLGLTARQIRERDSIRNYVVI